MIQIKPVSDLRNKFPDIEKIVNEGEPVYLTKNGYGAMVVLSLEAYSKLTDGVESKLDEADFAAENCSRHYTHDEVFSGLRRKIND
ncbi:type II toxin-antitoxin system Phd/YefM family antitoxin [Ruminococcus gauvreauii]|uniref:Antitoxin n=1 Tax=Ruminococcus gauvreauii TaxID=438033 RepID=A0ABY5VLW6_9FIRM|nr:type II toxin-antitoxin system Phd/YefM family antitoxin [Ruminococcus gauvreauii]UWP60998.1 type II toxin-antitoxin system Phd/YefM family antitoxin [Ruminococcus gauvreauii]